MKLELTKGLSSDAATANLIRELRDTFGSINHAHWIKHIFVPAFPLINIALTVTCGILLLVAGFLGNQPLIFAEGLFLLVLGVLSVLSHIREVYTSKCILKLKLMECLSKISLRRTTSSEESSLEGRYPPNELQTARGFFTVPTLRDNRLVHLPHSLLTQGDVIKLTIDRVSPARVELCDSKEILEEGDKLSPNMFAAEAGSVQLVEAREKFCRVLTSPLVSKLTRSVAIECSPPSLEKEVALMFKLWFYVIVWVVAVAVCLWNVVRYVVLPGDVPEWYDIILQQSVHVVLPLILPHFHVFKALLYAYCAGRTHYLIHKKDKCSGISGSTSLASCIKQKLLICKLTLKCLFSLIHFAMWRLCASFGSATVLCSVDKEYVLSPVTPIPDKVFFLRSSTNSTDKSAKQKMTKPSKDLARKRFSFPSDQLSEDEVSSELFLSCPTLEENPLPAEDSEVHRVEEDKPPLHKSASSSRIEEQKGASRCRVRFKDEHTQSLEELDEDVNITTETLGMSTRPDELGEIFFDDIDWKSFLDSLKAIGFSSVAMSHLCSELNLTTAHALSAPLLQDLRASDCLCPLGLEIGVTGYAVTQFESGSHCEILSVCQSIHGPAHTSRSVNQLLTTLGDDSTALPYMLSMLLQHRAGSCQLFSRSTSDFAVCCCQEFWNGDDLLPLGHEERKRIRDFFARRSLLAHAVVFSYKPILDSLPSNLSSGCTTLTVPPGMLLPAFVDTAQLHLGEPDLAKQLYSLQQGQIFLGIVALQYQPFQDIVVLIEDLDQAGIRFVHFSAESEIRENIFSERMGLETGWNCHISLAKDSKKDRDENTDDSDGDMMSRSSSDSSLGAAMQGKASYIRAKLPKGIANIRPHLNQIDNVPLLVPLFTQCQPPAIREMIQIMQEFGEVVIALGNAYNPDNLEIFSQANLSLGLMPNGENLNCLASMYSSTPKGRDGHLVPNSALADAMQLNTLPCHFVLPRHTDTKLMTLILESRQLLSNMRHASLFSLASSLLIFLVLCLATLFYLPPPLSGTQLFHLVFFTVPVLASWMVSIRADPQLKSTMPDKNKSVWSEKTRLLAYFLFTFFPTAVVSVLLFGLSLSSSCGQLLALTNSSRICHPILGDRDEESQWNGWRGLYAPELALSQSVNAVFVSLCLVILSTRFVHRTVHIWRLYRFLAPQWVVVIAVLPLLHILHSTSYFSIRDSTPSLEGRPGLEGVPVYVWVLGVVWLIVLFPVIELTKHHDRNLISKSQRFLRLEFGTKLGMNSPF